MPVNHEQKLKSSELNLRAPRKNAPSPSIVDSLCAAGVSVSEEEHIEHILDGLSEEFDRFVTTILSCHEPYTVEEIEALLLDQEESLERHQQVNSSP